MSLKTFAHQLICNHDYVVRDVIYTENLFRECIEAFPDLISLINWGKLSNLIDAANIVVPKKYPQWEDPFSDFNKFIRHAAHNKMYENTRATSGCYMEISLCPKCEKTRDPTLYYRRVILDTLSRFLKYRKFTNVT